MRTLFFIIYLSIASISAYAQEYRKIRVGVGFSPLNNSHTIPILYTEPSYRFTDSWAIGLRLEVAGILSGGIGTSSRGLSGQYYLSNSKVRPFVGLGIGRYNFIDYRSYSENQPFFEKNKIGFYPRLGFDYGHLTINIEYNMMTPVKVTTVDLTMIEPPSISYTNGNYFAIKIGLSIGGGKKK